MNDSDKNPDTQLPRAVSLGDVLNSIRMAPQDISRLLSDWSAQYVGGTHHTLGMALRAHAQMVADPQTYGWKPPQDAAAPDQVPPVEQRASYGHAAPGRTQGAPTATPAAPQAPGQATTPGTLATPAATPSESSRASVAPQPTTPPTPPDADASGKAAEDARPLGTQDANGSNFPSHDLS